MKVKEFIANIYKDAQIAHELGDEITDQDYSRGLRNLNYVLRGMNIDKELITYRTKETLQFVVGQEIYNVNFVKIDVIYFSLNGSIRYTLYEKDIKDYFLKATVESASGFPSIFYLEPRQDFTLDINIYMFPFSSDSFTIHGKRAFTEFSIDDFFPAELIPYEMYLNYATGMKLRQVMGMVPNPGLDGQASLAKSQLLSMKDRITTITPSNAGRGRVRTWADVNIGRGFSPDAR